jgi:hypothetical protein
MAKQPVESSAAIDLQTLRQILGRFNDARCVLECAVRSLEQWQSLDDAEDESCRSCDPEIVCLRHAQRLLADVYDDLDTAIAQLANSARAPGEQ